MTDKKETLSEKIHRKGLDETKKGWYFEEDVKKKIQNAERRLKEKIKFKSQYNWLRDEIDKIFKEEFGDKLIK